MGKRDLAKLSKILLILIYGRKDNQVALVALLRFSVIVAIFVDYGTGETQHRSSGNGGPYVASFQTAAEVSSVVGQGFHMDTLTPAVRKKGVFANQLII